MEFIVSTLRGISLCCLLFFLADVFFGVAYSHVLKRVFHRISEAALRGAVIDLYHQKIDKLLRFASRRIGEFFPKVSVFLAFLCFSALLFFLGGLVQAIQENTHFAKGFFFNLSIYSVVSTVSASFCYTATYFVLHLIRSNTGPFLPRYFYLVSFEVVLSYILAPAAYSR